MGELEGQEMNHCVESLDLQSLTDDITLYWYAACQHDGLEMERNATFIEFSAENPWITKYQEAVKWYFVVCQLAAHCIAE